WTDVHTKVLTEGYSKAGDPNPRAGLFIYNVLNKDTVHIDVGNDPDQYIYGIDFTKDGTELLFHRMNRRQNVVEVLAASVKTGQSRVVVKEEQKTWQRQAPEMKFLQDGYRFIWETEKNGWKNYELRDLGGKLITTLTNDEFPVNKIEMIREESSLPGGGTLYYTAFSDVNKLNSQLHIVNLDGSGHTVLTKLPLNHRVNVSPNGKWFVSEYQSIEMPPTTGLFDNTGNEVAERAESDTTKMKKMGLAWPESVICASPDGETELYGVLYKPSNFDPHKKYPLVISVYGGPESQSVENVFKPAQPGCELGFLIAQFDNRGTVNRGKKFEEALYLNLGSVELDDQAAGVKFLAQREYVDATRVGIFGFSYGGYMSALALLKQPDVFQVAVAGGTVTDWKNYDSIYTERYMQTPQANPKGYEESSCLTHIDALKGHLLLLHGMVDDNVHPTNLWQFVDLLQKAGKPFDMMLFANSGHGFRMMEAEYRWPYLYEHLIGDHAEESKPSLAAGADTKKERESVPQ
ncbi:MAG TPA: prolyl oligopeptidase family serine peptidase, partial [Phycisphaerales bacterium]|nr:prolyl oligopeptidase family serine peptidase [Phycisphaerales bacterium]